MNYSHVLGTKLQSRNATVGIIGLGYVGLPLAVSAASVFPTIGFDLDPRKVEAILSCQSYINAVSDERLRGVVDQGCFSATTDLERLSECDVIVICVPTPLSSHREPDLSFVIATTEMIAASLRKGQLIVLESTTYPGTTEEVMKPILQAGGLMSRQDFFLAFSPEREDPGNTVHETKTIPKIVAGEGRDANDLASAFYDAFIDRVVTVSTPATAEAVKITENVFRSVNIALVNELKMIYDAMGIDIWEVIEAAATKPFGYMPFYPGPGLGGHCIPIDPFYLSWKAREYGLSTRFIELAGEINLSMPRYVVRRLEEVLDRELRKSVGSSRILVAGIAYKKNVSDMRESPSTVMMEMLAARGANVDYTDPHVPVIPELRDHPELHGRRSVNPKSIEDHVYDLVLIATDHDAFDYPVLASKARLVLDTRNAMARRKLDQTNVFSA
ncbi:nucleotide sugar dehydrogenase [Notoacmeibacter ruber]|uniref:Nucleotide sugar dehydrogenase n=1 Tax=Notoacmeibacter ruber TaxID=2670375 RepID=A0A3L7J2Z5_9HYPH|nr:nucleotide sugar dehydrogenase [Notoacmeibacter ruber]RLQ84998.1 nucleotide sugar dehydrogenase [Notoacmeibacter ruber]